MRSNFWKSCRAGAHRFTFAAAALILAAAFLFPAPAPGADSETAMKQTRRISVLAFGDSLFAGFGLADPNDSLPSVLGRMLADDGYNVQMVNAGLSGDTTAGGLARLDWSLQERPDAALLELGANDGLMGLSARAMEANLEAMLQRLADKDVPVLLVGMRAIANYGPDYAQEFDAVFPRLAERHGVPLYPFLLEGVVQRPGLNQADGVHPNAAGVREIAARLYPMVRDLVETVLTQ